MKASETREQMEHSLRESEGRLRVALASAETGAWDWDLVTGVHTWDARMRELWGLAAEDPVSFDVFARPAILKMMGQPVGTPTVEAELAEPMHSDGRQTYVRVSLERSNGKLIAHSTGNQSSGVLTSLVQADGLMIVPEGLKDIPAGSRLPVRLFTEII